MKRIALIISVLLVVAGIYLYNNQHSLLKSLPSRLVPGVNVTALQKQEKVKVVAENLQIPWEIAFLPTGEMLVTERPGRLLKITADKTVINVEGVHHVGEGGLLGMALHPDFANNNWIYLYLTTQTDNGLKNRVERYKLDGNTLVDKKDILIDIPGAVNHDGGRIVFGPDGMLYITTGDAGVAKSAQDLKSLAGKILRLRDDGSIPDDNPYLTAVYSYGHRNPQGLAWDDKGRLWATEHGRSGDVSGFDELNLIEKGGNYGWPTIQGDEKAAGMITPKINSGSKETWAPAAAVYLNGSIFFAGLRGESLYEAKIDAAGNVMEIKAHLKGQYGRLRALTLGPDAYLYLSTSNRDGRGDVNEADDKIIKFHPEIFSSFSTNQG